MLICESSDNLSIWRTHYLTHSFLDPTVIAISRYRGPRKAMRSIETNVSTCIGRRYTFAKLFDALQVSTLARLLPPTPIIFDVHALFGGAFPTSYATRKTSS